MPLLDVRRLAPGFTEYRVTSDGAKHGCAACFALLAVSLVSMLRQLVLAGKNFFKLLLYMLQAALAWRFHLWVQVSTSCAASRTSHAHE